MPNNISEPDAASQPQQLLVSVSPHIHSHESAPKVMWSVFFALIPAGLAGIFIFGLCALKIIVISILTCMGTEALLQKLCRRKITVSDGSAALTGILLAYNLSSHVPLWIPVAGGIFAIAIAKQAFGGLGANIFNPALAGRAFLLASWPKHMTEFVKPLTPDAVTQATPLTMFKEAKVHSLAQLDLSYLDLFLGKRG
jgi:electron transport complex protein RnfD